MTNEAGKEGAVQQSWKEGTTYRAREEGASMNQVESTMVPTKQEGTTQVLHKGRRAPAVGGGRCIASCLDLLPQSINGKHAKYKP